MTERSYSWSEIPHLAQRTLWSLRRPTADPGGEAWLVERLNPAQVDLYRRMSEPDQAHAIACGRAVKHLGDEVVVASALHDVGKNQAALGTAGRVVATVVGLVTPEMGERWAASPGFRGRIAAYLDHTLIGADMLAQAGSSQLAIDWARDHHLDPHQSSIPADLFAHLKAADD